jgi:hypothetical protein
MANYHDCHIKAGWEGDSDMRKPQTNQPMQIAPTEGGELRAMNGSGYEKRVDENRAIRDKSYSFQHM